jgi:RND family efflux transporter MFP subunit
VLGLAVLASCGGEKETPQAPIRPVRYAAVLATGGARERTFSGIAQAGVESSLSFKVAGTVERVAVKVGDAVRRDQVMVALDASDYRLRVREAEASLTQAQAQERNARSAHERVRTLYENRNASRQDLDAARAAHESASALVETIERRLDLARLQVDYTELRAPFAASVAEVRVELNENVSPGSPVVLLTAGRKPEVTVSVPGVLIAQVAVGSAVSVHFDALPDRTFPAVVTEVGVASSAFATTFPVTVCLENETDAVRPGMSAEVAFRFETASAEECFVVPTVAVGEDRDGRFVFVVEPADSGFAVARRRPVVVGELTAEGLEIRSGVRDGELVVTAGVTRIVDGQRVRLF